MQEFVGRLVELDFEKGPEITTLVMSTVHDQRLYVIKADVSHETAEKFKEEVGGRLDDGANLELTCQIDDKGDANLQFRDLDDTDSPTVH